MFVLKQMKIAEGAAEVSEKMFSALTFFEELHLFSVCQEWEEKTTFCLRCS